MSLRNLGCCELRQICCVVALLVGFALRLQAIEAQNSYVKISTGCPDVLAITPVDRDFHLLVTKASAIANVVVSAVDPWGLVLPDFGSCTVSLAYSGNYEVEDTEPDDDGNVEPNKYGRIIIFKPMFSVSSEFGSGLFELRRDEGTNLIKHVLEDTKGDLTDNHTARVDVNIVGAVNSLRGHRVEMSVVPEMKDHRLLHHESVNPRSVRVFVDASKNRWPTSRVYWYGVDGASAGCCYKTRYNYVFELNVDGVVCCSRKYNVGWPNEEAMYVEGRNIGMSGYDLAQSDGAGRFKVKLRLTDFKRVFTVCGPSSSCQYANEIAKEEAYHKRQGECEIPVEKGGHGDLYTAKGIMYCITNSARNTVSSDTTLEVVGDDVYICASDALTAELGACEAVSYFESLEEELSFSLQQRRRLLKEYWAKDYAGYNAAFKYHCTYGQGSNEEPQYEKHPAFLGTH